MQPPPARVAIGCALGLCGGALLAASFFMPMVRPAWGPGGAPQSLAASMFTERGRLELHIPDIKDGYAGIASLVRAGNRNQLDGGILTVNLITCVTICPCFYGVMVILRIAVSRRGRLPGARWFWIAGCTHAVLGLLALSAWIIGSDIYVAVPAVWPVWIVGLVAFIRLLAMSAPGRWSTERCVVGGQVVLGILALTWTQIHYVWVLRHPTSGFVLFNQECPGFPAMLLAGLLLVVGAALEGSAAAAPVPAAAQA